nr:uncharacterized protein LOC112210742 [Halyomorpha halys]
MIPVLARAMLYADDLVLVADNAESLQVDVVEWQEELQLRGMKARLCVLEERTKISESIAMERPLSKLTPTPTWKQWSARMEVVNKVQKANGILYQLSMSLIGKQELSRKAKILLFKSFFLLVLYGSKSWTALDRHANKVVSAEIRFLRKILGKNT